MIRCDKCVYCLITPSSIERERMTSVNPEFTLIYDDLSWEARDLRLAAPVERRGLHFEPELKAYKYARQSMADRDIRRRFGYAIEDFVRIVSEMNPKPDHNGLHVRDRELPYKAKLLPMSKFLAKFNDVVPGHLHMALPMNPIFVSFHFADIAAEEDDKVSIGLYSSPETIASIKDWHSRTLGTNSTFSNDSQGIRLFKDLSRICSLALIKENMSEFSERQLEDAWRQSRYWLDEEFTAIQRALAAKLGQEQVPPITAHNDVFFADAKDNRCADYNIAAITTIEFDAKSDKYIYQRNVTEADTLRQVITEGLAGNPRSSDWSKFLTKGLYDPRLFLHVWDMINHKEEPD